jgi:hypothetical protein
MKQSLVKLLISSVCAPLIFTFSGCKTTSGDVHVGWGSEPTNCHPNCSKKVEKGGPPPHAPAHGYRAKYAYRYYPSSYVYFDASRKVYFYFENHCWWESASLPKDIRLKRGHYVTIEMDDDKPYSGFKDHVHKYPQGQLKKKNKNWAGY